MTRVCSAAAAQHPEVRMVASECRVQRGELGRVAIVELFSGIELCMAGAGRVRPEELDALDRRRAVQVASEVIGMGAVDAEMKRCTSCGRVDLLDGFA